MLSRAEEHFLDNVFSTIKNYIAESEDAHVVHPRSPEELKRTLPGIGQTGITHAQLHKELKDILSQSVRSIHPLFLNQLSGGFDPAAWIGDVVGSLLNPTMATFEVAPLMTVIEKRIVGELLALLGMKSGEGIMVTGGSNANLLAMLCARTAHDASIRRAGYTHNRFRVYASVEAHYSFDKAANICGIGTQNLVLVPANERGEMIPEELERRIAQDRADGFTPLMVAATVGTTVLGACDSVAKIGAIARENELWFHVDAAWGGGALFSRTARHMLKGIEAADSVTLDAHKSLGTALITSFFLTSRPGILKMTNRGGGDEYLFHSDREEWDTGTYSLQCGRRGDALKLWLLWRLYGTEGLIERTEQLLDLARAAAAAVDADSRFTLLHAHYLNVCFQVRPSDPQEDINAFTLAVRKALVAEGRALVNYAQRSDGTTFIRLVFPNHQTRAEHVAAVLGLISETADRIEAERAEAQLPIRAFG